MGIIQSNKDRSTSTSFLVFGDLKTGKSYKAAGITEAHNPLFITFGSADTLGTLKSPIDFAENPTIDELENIFRGLETNSADYKAYGAVVLDGLFGYATALLQKIGGNNIQQQHWGLMGKTIEMNIVRLKRARPLVGATILTALSPEGVREATINPDLFNRVVPYFSNVIYTAAKATENGVVYNVQEEAVAALAFKPSSKGK